MFALLEAEALRQRLQALLKDEVAFHNEAIVGGKLTPLLVDVDAAMPRLRQARATYQQIGDPEADALVRTIAEVEALTAQARARVTTGGA